MLRKAALPMTIALALCGCKANATYDQAASAPQAATSAPVASSPAEMPMADPPSSSPSVANLEGTEWRFVEVEGQPVPASVTATMRLHNGHASGKAGCNAYGASYTIAPDGAAHFKQGISTKMACLQPAGAMRVEQGVFSALRQTAKVQRNGDNLTLLDKSGHAVAKLTATGS